MAGEGDECVVERCLLEAQLLGNDRVPGERRRDGGQQLPTSADLDDVAAAPEGSHLRQIGQLMDDDIRLHRIDRKLQLVGVIGVDEHGNGPLEEPPAWCPLRAGPITVELTERSAG